MQISKMTDDQLRKMFGFIQEFMIAVKVVNMKFMAEITKEAADYLKNEGLTAEDFGSTVQAMNQNKPIPDDDLFFTNLKKQF